MVDWARSCGFRVIAAGKGTKYLPEYHASTPKTVWGHYGLTPEAAQQGGMNPQMFNSFLDGTKSGIEMAAVANATGLTPPPDGLAFPPCGTDSLARMLRPANQDGALHHAGQVEVVSSVHRDGSQVANDLRWGVYVVFEAPNDYTMRCFTEYGVPTDPTGRFSALYRPFHLIGLELNVSILSAALRGEPTGAPDAFRADVVATAKRDLKAGETLDGEGGDCVWGKVLPAATSLAIGGLPIGLASRVPVTRDVKAGQPVTWDDVRMDPSDEAYRYRRAMEDAVG
jgi:predicted homoserine dehydrogenase-like protein